MFANCHKTIALSLNVSVTYSIRLESLFSLFVRQYFTVFKRSYFIQYTVDGTLTVVIVTIAALKSPITAFDNNVDNLKKLLCNEQYVALPYKLFRV